MRIAAALLWSVRPRGLGLPIPVQGRDAADQFTLLARHGAGRSSLPIPAALPRTTTRSLSFQISEIGDAPSTGIGVDASAGQEAPVHDPSILCPAIVQPSGSKPDILSIIAERRDEKWRTIHGCWRWFSGVSFALLTADAIARFRKQSPVQPGLQTGMQPGAGPVAAPQAGLRDCLRAMERRLDRIEAALAVRAGDAPAVSTAQLQAPGVKQTGA